MATMVVLTFKDEPGALQKHDMLAGLLRLELIKLSDAAVVVRPRDGKATVWAGRCSAKLNPKGQVRPKNAKRL